MSDQIEVLIHLTDGSPFNVLIGKSQTCQTLKQKIQEILKIPPENQTLYTDSTEIQNDSMIKDCIFPGKTLFLKTKEDSIRDTPGTASQLFTESDFEKALQAFLPLPKLDELTSSINTLNQLHQAFNPVLSDKPKKPSALCLVSYLQSLESNLQSLISSISKIAHYFEIEPLITDQQSRNLIESASKQISIVFTNLAEVTQPLIKLLPEIEVKPFKNPTLKNFNFNTQANLKPGDFETPFSQNFRQNPSKKESRFSELLFGHEIDENEAMPMMEFLYNIKMSEVSLVFAGNLEAIERQRDTVKNRLMNIMEEDSKEGRMTIVQVVLSMLLSSYQVPSEYSDKFSEDFDISNLITDLSEKWVLELVNLVLDYTGNEFIKEIKHILYMLLGQYTYNLSQVIQGGYPATLNFLQSQINLILSTNISPAYMQILQALLPNYLSEHINYACTLYRSHFL